MQYKNVFPRRLTTARSLTGITQTDAARGIGTSQSMIAKLERGHLEPNLNTLGAIALFYNVTTDWLIGIEE